MGIIISLFRPLNVIILTPFLILEEASFLNDFWKNLVFSNCHDCINNTHSACKKPNFPRVSNGNHCLHQLRYLCQNFPSLNCDLFPSKCKNIEPGAQNRENSVKNSLQKAI